MKTGATSASCLLSFLALAACGPEPPAESLRLPAFGEAAYRRIAEGIYRNETGGDARYLAHWNQGEDFPSFGIGHFIWFPAGVDAPFDETFPGLVRYLAAHPAPCARMPDWLAALDAAGELHAPWPDKPVFDAAANDPRLIELRAWLAASAGAQAQFIVERFAERWRELDLAADERARLDAVLAELMRTPEGQFAVIDYVNFKGLGTNEGERYQGEGWGLLQVLRVLQGPQGPVSRESDPVRAFAATAAAVLERRVALSPPERNEARWLPGWRDRVRGYTMPPGEGTSGGFRVRPYVQPQGDDSLRLVWFSATQSAGSLSIEPVRPSVPPPAPGRVEPVPACALAYHGAELADLEGSALPAPPYRHDLPIAGLVAGEEYRYALAQDGETATGSFRAPDHAAGRYRFVVYGDSETEPESATRFAPWGGEDGDGSAARYPIDEATGYRNNLALIHERKPDTVFIAGDLVESGGEQRDWDEFWRENAALAATTPVLAAPGNHDYFGGPGVFGRYDAAASRRAIDRFATYFNRGPGEDGKRYFAIRRGPVTFVVLDAVDGLPHRTDRDSNWYLESVDGAPAPDWNPGSEQYAWLEETLAQAREASAFVFVVLHMAPYSSGVHGLPPGDGAGEDPLSGRPLRALTPLFEEHRVDAVFSGHDEFYEHSVVAGGVAKRARAIHFFVAGIGGDGLRSYRDEADNAYRVFAAGVDAPATYDEGGGIVDGGQHYGHLEIDVTREEAGWEACIEPVYVLPPGPGQAGDVAARRRVYDDVTVLAENEGDRHGRGVRCSGAAGEGA